MPLRQVGCRDGRRMNIGEASRASEVSAKMIRYYEQIGLMPAMARTEAGYRVYGHKDVHRLHFIRRARDLGFSVAEIGDLLGLWDDGARHSADVKRLAQAHIVELERRMHDMQQMASTLKTLIRSCAGDDRPDCPILAELEQPAAVPPVRPAARAVRARSAGLARATSAPPRRR